jgi:hypothetical protein
VLGALDRQARAWGIGLSSQYCQEAVSNVVKDLAVCCDMGLSAKATAPMSNRYRPEIYVSEELSPEQANFYQSLTGILQLYYRY